VFFHGVPPFFMRPVYPAARFTRSSVFYGFEVQRDSGSSIEVLKMPGNNNVWCMPAPGDRDLFFGVVFSIYVPIRRFWLN